QHGGGSLTQALKGVAARTLLIAFSSDWLYPPTASEEVATALRSLGKPVEFEVIEAPYGHDCFLLEEARQTPIIQRFLRSPERPTENTGPTKTGRSDLSPASCTRPSAPTRTPAPGPSRS